MDRIKKGFVKQQKIYVEVRFSKLRMYMSLDLLRHNDNVLIIFFLKFGYTFINLYSSILTI